YYGKTITDLELLPLPARHLLKDKQGGNIFAYNNNYIGDESTVIISTRGCPYKCSFCSAPKLTHSNKVRFRKAESVASEMRHVINTYGIRQFRFSDDMFTANKKKMLALCEEIGRLGAIWRISCRVKPLDEEMLRAMWDAGCRELSLGIESFDDAVLKGLNKNATCKDNVKALELSAKVGYKTRILFMIRTPFQTRNTIEINKYWIERLPFTIMACTSFIPIPGCDVWYNPDKYNIEILDRDLDKYNFYMFGPDGKRPLDAIIKIKDRPLDEFMRESEEFRDWVDDFGKINRG
ncbi:MAG TPA: radical SAM protein, partial [Spirochaetota bacterium]|nr:radical SAM protein [Spirochaetota bacterium]